MTLKIALAQLNLLVGDIEGNADSVIKAAIRARDRQGAHALVFPELTLTGYPPEDLLLRPELVLRLERALEVICRSTTGIDLVLGYPRAVGGRLFNAAGVIREGRIITEYHKQYLPNFSVFDEKRYFVPGREACVCRIRGVPTGISICEDIWEAGPTAQAVDAGARLLLNLNASPYHVGKAPPGVRITRRAFGRDRRYPLTSGF